MGAKAPAGHRYRMDAEQFGELRVGIAFLFLHGFQLHHKAGHDVNISYAKMLNTMFSAGPRWTGPGEGRVYVLPRHQP